MPRFLKTCKLCVSWNGSMNFTVDNFIMTIYFWLLIYFSQPLALLNVAAIQQEGWGLLHAGLEPEGDWEAEEWVLPSQIRVRCLGVVCILGRNCEMGFRASKHRKVAQKAWWGSRCNGQWQAWRSMLCREWWHGIEALKYPMSHILIRQCSRDIGSCWWEMLFAIGRFTWRMFCQHASVLASWWQAAD